MPGAEWDGDPPCGNKDCRCGNKQWAVDLCPPCEAAVEEECRKEAPDAD